MLDSSGTKQWETSDLGAMGGVPIIGNGDNVYVVTGSTLVALDKSTGATAWTNDIGGDTLSSISPTMDASGNLYLFDASGYLYKVSTDCTGPEGSAQWAMLMRDAQHSAKLT